MLSPPPTLGRGWEGRIAGQGMAGMGTCPGERDREVRRRGGGGGATSSTPTRPRTCGTGPSSSSRSGRGSSRATRCSTSPAATPGWPSRCSTPGSATCGVDLSGPMVEAARATLGDARRDPRGRPERLHPARAGPGDDLLPRDLLRPRPPRVLPPRRLLHGEEARLRPESRQYRVEDVLADLAAAGLDRFELRPFFSPQRVSLPRPARRRSPRGRTHRPARAAGAPLPLQLHGGGVTVCARA